MLTALSLTFPFDHFFFLGFFVAAAACQEGSSIVSTYSNSPPSLQSMRTIAAFLE
jgi:hypothetical protein